MYRTKSRANNLIVIMAMNGNINVITKNKLDDLIVPGLGKRGKGEGTLI